MAFITRLASFTVKGFPVIEEGESVKAMKQYVVLSTDDDGMVTKKVKYLGSDFRTVMVGNGHTLAKGKDGQYAPADDLKIMVAPIDGSSREEELARVRAEAIEEYKRSLLTAETVQTQK